MYLPTITKHKPNNVYSLQIKSTTNKNIYIYSTNKAHAKIMYIDYIYIDQRSNLLLLIRIYISLTCKIPFSETKIKQIKIKNAKKF